MRKKVRDKEEQKIDTESRSVLKPPRSDAGVHCVSRLKLATLVAICKEH